MPQAVQGICLSSVPRLASRPGRLCRACRLEDKTLAAGSPSRTAGCTCVYDPRFGFRENADKPDLKRQGDMEAHMCTLCPCCGPPGLYWADPAAAAQSVPLLLSLCCCCSACAGKGKRPHTLSCADVTRGRHAGADHPVSTHRCRSTALGLVQPHPCD